MEETQQWAEIAKAHDGYQGSKEGASLGGHFGRDKTVAVVKNCAFFPAITEKVRRYILTCRACQLVKAGSKFEKGGETLKSIPVPTGVWKQIGIDLITNCKPTEEGHNAIVTAVCYTSKYVEARAIKGKDAEQVAQFMFSLLCRHGASNIHITDQGREFCNQAAILFYKMTGIKHRVTSPYHPQANGLVERQNRTTQECLQKCKESFELLRGSVNEAASDWYKRLEGIIFAYNTRKHASTKFSPFRLMYQRDPIMPWEDDDPFQSEAKEMSIEQSVEHMDNIREKVLVEAVANIRKAQKKQAKYYNKKHEKTVQYKIGDKVLRKNMKDLGRKAKGTRKYLGPYVVVGHGERGGYYLENMQGKRLQNLVAAYQLKLFHERDNDMEVEESSDSEFEDDILDNPEADEVIASQKDEVIASSDIEESPPPSPVKSSQFAIPPPPDNMYSAACILREQLDVLPTISEGVVGDAINSPVKKFEVAITPGQVINVNNTSLNSSINSCYDISTSGVIKPAEQIYFFPLSRYLRKGIATSKFNLTGGRKAGETVGDLNYDGVGKLCTDQRPATSVKATPDGNCLFRSLSYLLVSNQRKHDVIRHYICEFIAEESNWEKLKPLIEKKYTSGADYVKRTEMANNATWGTEVEIFVFAMITGKDVVVHAHDRWLRYQAGGLKGKATKQAWYIVNSGDHFDPVIRM